jgi:predicted nucleic acid-binding protein
MASPSTALPLTSHRPFFDTTILIYSISSYELRAEMAEKNLADGGRIRVQVLNQFAEVARSKLNFSWEEAGDRCPLWLSPLRCTHSRSSNRSWL